MSDVFMIDFSANAPLPFAELLGRFVNPAAVINRCLFHPNPQGARLVSPQVPLIVHEDEPFEIDWRGPYELQPARHRVEAGQFHLVPAHTPMEVAREGEQRAAIITFRPDFVDRIVRKQFKGDAPRLRPHAALSDSLVQSLCTALCGKIGAKGRHLRACAEAIATLLVIHLLAHFGVGGTVQPSISGGLTGAQQRLTLDYISSHGRQEFDVNELAAATGLSRRHFQRAFKQSFGETPCRYAHNTVMAAAVELVLGTRKSITEIALDLGFGNFGNFSTAFKKHTGMSPEAFRRRNG
ncbi:MAG: AraC family transcriptional regulator [Alphaproteobacteria bacterium]|nr:AraC family transcriptional regulator [Alphaproteobacteria bacterium]